MAEEQPNPTTEHTDPVITPETAPSAPKTTRKKLYWGALIALLAVALVGTAGAIWYKSTHANLLTSNNNYICTSGGLHAIQCENLDTKQLTKFEIPAKYGSLELLQMSPDGNKIFLSSYDSQYRMQEFVIDRDMKLIKKVHVRQPGEGFSNYTWLADSSGLVYSYRTIEKSQQAYGPSQLYIYDLNSGNKRQLTHYKAGISYPQVLQDGRILASLEGEGIRTHYALVDIVTGKATKINMKELYKETSDTANVYYSRATDKIYLADSHNNKLARVGELRKSDGSYHIVVLKTFRDKNIGDFRLVTSKGVPTDSIDSHYNEPNTLYDGKQTTSISLDMRESVVIALNRLPFDNAAASAKLTASDYLLERTTPPVRLQKFLVDHLSDGCKAGQYRNVEVQAYEGDSQVMVYEGVCGDVGKNYASIYVYLDGTYKNIASSQEGFSCDLRDQYNLSAKVLSKTDCRDPNEEL